MHLLAERSPIADAPIYFIDETDSTMDDLARLIEDGAPHGSVVVTGFQSAGRGRRPGRRWWSPPGTALMFSVALHREPAPATQSLRMATAIADEILDRFRVDVRIKWPNDVLVDGRKACGILADARADWLLIGVGLNCLQQSFPADLDGHATSLTIEAPDAPRDTLDPSRLLCPILTRFVALDPWHSRMNELLWRVGEPVTVTAPDGTRTTGVVDRVSEHGGLELLNDGVTTVVAGELAAAAMERS